MRARVIFFLVAILLVAGFAALNWSEVVRPTQLSFGAFITEAPLGLILLTLLGIVSIAFLLSAASMRTQNLVESRHHFKTLEAQRELADKAEASRFTELRQYMDTQLKDLRQRDAIAATEFEKAMVGAQRELRTQLEQMNRMMMTRFGEFETRLDSRFERFGSMPLKEQVALDQQIRDEQLRAERMEPPPQVRRPL